MAKIYKPLYLLETPIIFTSLETSELIKYASNAFLALKISYINQIADLCEKVDADISDVSKGMGLDNRIGSKFLHPGPGYGGSCFPKDTIALVKIAEDNGNSLSLINETVKYNEQRKIEMVKKISKSVNGNLKGKNISILGLSFKPETDDMRDSPALVIIPKLIESGVKVKVYDPAAMEEAKKFISEEIKYFKTAIDCIIDSDILVILTEWNEFRALSLKEIKKSMRNNILIDLRNIYSRKEAEEAGFKYTALGK